MKTIKIKKVKVDIDKLVTMAEMGLGVERPQNKKKRTTWGNALMVGPTFVFWPDCQCRM